MIVSRIKKLTLSFITLLSVLLVSFDSVTQADLPPEDMLYKILTAPHSVWVVGKANIVIVVKPSATLSNGTVNPQTPCKSGKTPTEAGFNNVSSGFLNHKFYITSPHFTDGYVYAASFNNNETFQASKGQLKYPFVYTTDNCGEAEVMSQSNNYAIMAIQTSSFTTDGKTALSKPQIDEFKTDTGFNEFTVGGNKKYAQTDITQLVKTPTNPQFGLVQGSVTSIAETPNIGTKEDLVAQRVDNAKQGWDLSAAMSWVPAAANWSLTWVIDILFYYFIVLGTAFSVSIPRFRGFPFIFKYISFKRYTTVESEAVNFGSAQDSNSKKYPRFMSISRLSTLWFMITFMFVTMHLGLLPKAVGGTFAIFGNLVTSFVNWIGTL
jgi:hypothetical protein